MFTQEHYEGTLQEKYDLLSRQLDALLEGEQNVTANLANASALLNQFLDRTNWVGFYVMEGEEELVLGPFQGLPACVRIALGKGVCGTAARDRHGKPSRGERHEWKIGASSRAVEAADEQEARQRYRPDRAGSSYFSVAATPRLATARS